MTSVRKPICRLLSKAVEVVGPAMTTRCSRCNASISPGRWMDSAYRPSVGRNISAKSVVWGGTTYFLADRLGLDPDRAFQLRAGAAHAVHVAAFLRIQEALVVLARGNLASISRPHVHVILAATGQAHHLKSTRLVAAGRTRTARELLAGQHLVEDALQPLRPSAAVLDVGQHALEVADAGGQRLHFAEAALPPPGARTPAPKDWPSRVSKVACSFRRRLRASQQAWPHCRPATPAAAAPGWRAPGPGQVRCAARARGPAGQGCRRTAAAGSPAPAAPCAHHRSRRSTSSSSRASVRWVRSTRCRPKPSMRCSCCRDRLFQLLAQFTSAPRAARRAAGPQAHRPGDDAGPRTAGRGSPTRPTATGPATGCSSPSRQCERRRRRCDLDAAMASPAYARRSPPTGATR